MSFTSTHLRRSAIGDRLEKNAVRAGIELLPDAKELNELHQAAPAALIDYLAPGVLQMPSHAAPRPEF